MSTETPPRLRWGILGCARIARRGLIPGIQESQSGTLTALASRDLGMARAWAEEFGVPHAYGSYPKLLADPDHKVVDLYGVPVASHGDMKFAARQTFLISPQGKVVKFWPKVDVQTHSEEVLAEIAANKK